ncbi:hypothetical protein [Streptomyces sp. NPDC054804]
MDFPAEWHDPFDPPPGTWTAAVPVLELDARWLGRWAGLVAGAEPDWFEAPVLLLGAPEEPEELMPGRPSSPSGPSPTSAVVTGRTHAPRGRG